MDFNNDGIKDLIHGNGNGHVKYWQGVKDKVFKEMGAIKVNGSDFDVAYYSYIEATDWNEDGLWDLVIHGKHNWDNAPNLLLLINEGTKEQYKFTKVLQYKNEGGIGFPYIEPRVCPTIEDLNYDGKKDIILGMEDGEIRFYPNLGTNSAPEFDFDSVIVLENDGGKYWTEMIKDVKPDFADINGDGILDLVAGGSGGGNGGDYDYHMYVSYGYINTPVTNTKLSYNSDTYEIKYFKSGFSISNKTNSDVLFSVFNLRGQYIIHNRTIDSHNTIYLKNLTANTAYIVKFVTKNKTVFKRVVPVE